MSTSVRTRADRAAAATAGSGRHRSGRPSEGVLASWQAQPLSMRLLRAFLGVTFVYAGIQKLADPNFLHVGTPDYIGSQLKAFSLGSPIAGLLRVLGHAPLLIGIGIGAWIHGYVPMDFVVKYAGPGNPFAVIVAVLIGIPLYSNAAGTIPIVQALVEKGLPMGTALAFMMSIVAISAPELIILRKVIKPKLIAIFAGIVAVSIIIIGYLFNMIL